MDAMTAWAAGFFDGEGCIVMMAKANGSTKLHLSACQRVREPLDRLVELFGGRVYEREGIFTWRVESAYEAQRILRQMLPLLTVKREQAELVVALRWVDASKEDKAAIAAQVKEAKRPWLRAV